MRTIQTTVYKFAELSETAKDNAIKDFLNNPIDTEFCWDNIREDGEQIGLKIISLNDRRANEGKFVNSASETAKMILENHGEMCETYKTAQNFLSECETIQKQAEAEGKDGDEDYWYSDEIEEAEEEFLKSLLEDYRIMYNKNIEHSESDEAIIETIQANEYELTEDGELI